MCVWLRQPAADRGSSADPFHTISVISFRIDPLPGGDFGAQTVDVSKVDHKGVSYLKGNLDLGTSEQRLMRIGWTHAAHRTVHVFSEFYSQSKISL